MGKALTRWFPDHTKPARIGYYETRWYTGSLCHIKWWDGKAWSAISDFERHGFIQDIQWRGLREEPAPGSLKGE